MKRLKFLVCIAVLLAACNENPRVSDYTFLRRQLTPDKKHYIYWYDRPGPMAFSSDYYGLRILQIDEPFDENAGYNIDGMVDFWLSKDTLQVSRGINESTPVKDTLPVRVDYDTYQGIVIKKVFDHAGTGGGRNIFTFNSLKIENNRISFFNVNDHMPGSHHTFRFPLGAVMVHAVGDSVTLIEVMHNYKSMHFTRKDKSGKILTNQPEIGSDNYEFTPRAKLKVGELEKVGIFFDIVPAN